MLLTADLQLDDNPENEYRWKALTDAAEYVSFRGSVAILGDMTDNANRFSNYMVNRLVECLIHLRDCGADVYVLMGNHDKAKEGPPFWSFLNNIPNISYITEPLRNINELWLPYSANPAEEWAGLNWEGVQACFLHQTVAGSRVRGREVEVKKPFSLPPGIKYYAGDIHEPQQVGDVVYVGAPSPTDYGDDYPCRFLQINTRDYSIKREIQLYTIQKKIVTVRSLDDLHQIKDVYPEDRVRVKFELSAADVAMAPQLEQEVLKWAAAKQIQAHTLFPLSRIVGAAEGVPEYASAQEVLYAFAKAEGIEGNLLQAGKRIVDQLTLD